MDDVEKLTARAVAAADGILAQVLPDEGEAPKEIPLDAARALIAVGFSSGKQEGLAEGRVLVLEMQGHLNRLVKMLDRPAYTEELTGVSSPCVACGVMLFEVTCQLGDAPKYAQWRTRRALDGLPDDSSCEHEVS